MAFVPDATAPTQFVPDDPAQASKDDMVRQYVKSNAGDMQKMQGATLNWGVPAQAALMALTEKAQGSSRDYGDIYGHYRDLITQQLKQESAGHPVLSVANTLTGGAAIAPLLPELGGAGLVTRVAAGAGTGAVVGGVAGAGGAAPGQMARGAGQGAVAGAALGGAIPVLAAPVRALYSYATGLGADARAASAAHAAMGADGMSAAETASQLAAARAGGQPMSIADIAPPGGTTQGLARQAVTQPGPGRSIATDALQARGGPAQQARVGGIAQAAADTSPQQVSAAYDAAYPQQVLSQSDIAAPQGNPLADLLQSKPAFKTAHDANVGDPNADSPVPALFDAKGQITRPVTVRDIDVMKRTMDDQTARIGQPGIADADLQRLRSVAPLREQMLQLTDGIAPDYATARGLAQRQSFVDDSQAALARAANTRLSNYAGPVAGASPTSALSADALRRIPQQNQQAFLRAIARERTMNATDNFMLRGSATANKEAEAGMAGVLQDAGGQALGGKGITSSLLDSTVGAAKAAFNRQRNEQLASALFDTNSGRADAFLQKVQALQNARGLTPSYRPLGPVSTGLLSYGTGQ